MSAAPTNPASTPPGKPGLPPAAYGAIAGGAILVALLIVIVVYLPIISLWLSPVPPPVEPLAAKKVDAREREFTDRIGKAADKIVSRSPFHPKVQPPDPAPIVPTYYGGPSVVGVAGGAVYFSDGTSTKRIPLGQTIDDIQVIKIDAPWSVTLGWKGGKFDVPMLERKPVSFEDSPMMKDTLFKTAPAADAPRNN